MKTSKRKRSPKSEPAVEVLDSAPAAAASAEPAAVEVVASEPANEAVVAEAVAVEPVAPKAAAVESVVTEAVATDAVAVEPVVTEAAATEAVAAETVATEAVAVETAATEAVAPEAVVTEAVATQAVAAEAVVTQAVVGDAVAVEPIVVLAANCSVKDAAALKSSLCALVNESGAVTLDTSAVERVDTATMQLLCAFVRDRSARNQSVVWRGVSQALNDAVRLLGVAALLGFDEAKGAAT